MNLVEFALAVMARLGEPGVALLILLEGVFPPIPSEVILPLAGVAAASGEATYLGMLAASVTGSMGGAWLLYGLGRALGPERLRALFLRLPLLSVDDYDATVRWMERHGRAGIFLGRFVPGVRSLISIPAGLYAMPFGVFSLLTLAGSTIWNTIFVSAGYLLGSNWTVIEPWTDTLSRLAYAVIALLAVWTVVKLVRRERRRRALGLPDPDDALRRAAADPERPEPVGEGEPR